MKNIFSVLVLILQINAFVDAFSPSSRIVGGTNADYLEFPFIASLRTSYHFCGGMLIAPGYVLTAAHCPKPNFVRLGLHQQNDFTNNDVEDISVVSKIDHPNYDSYTMENDIALLVLSSNSVKYASSVIAPYFGANGGTDLEAPGQLLTIAGWGTLSSGGSSPNTLQKAQVPVTTDAECNAGYGSDYYPASMICAAYSNGGTDSCQGDSGGPMFDKTTNQVVGIVSWGISCASAGFPGVYTRISTYESWLCSNVNNLAGCPGAITSSPTPPTPTSPPTPPPTGDSFTCTLSSSGAYTGTVSKTGSGRTCQNWLSSEFHVPNYTTNENNNYCRNPGGIDDYPWCYTTDPNKRWEYCNVGSNIKPRCSDDSDEYQDIGNVDDCYSKIVNGDDVDVARKYPFQVSLQDASGYHFCGGTVVDGRTVMSAAHCNSGDGMYAVIGLHIQTESGTEICTERIKVLEHINHPQYDGNLNYDFMILKLVGPTKYPKAILYDPGMDSGAYETPNAQMVTSGWGALGTNIGGANTLQELDVIIEPQSLCNSNFGDSFYNDVAMLCVGPLVKPGSVCFGDSGGPLFFKSGNAHYLVGITSFVSGGDNACESGLPNGFARVSFARNWACNTIGVDCSSASSLAPTTTPPTDSPTKSPTTSPPTTRSPTTTPPTVAPTPTTANPTLPPTDSPTTPTANPTLPPTDSPTTRPTCNCGGLGSSQCKRCWNCGWSKGRCLNTSPTSQPPTSTPPPTSTTPPPTSTPEPPVGSCSDNCSSFTGGGDCKSCRGCRWRKGQCRAA